MKKLIIEKNIPIPASARSSKWKQLTSRMETGDSVLVETRNQACGLIGSAKFLPTDMKFTTRKTAEGIRVWRTA
jgi:hypothetical protein